MTSRIVLINPKLATWSPNVYVPLGLTYVAAALEKVNHNVQILDFNVRKVKHAEFEEKIRNAEIVGITGMLTEYHEIVQLAHTVRTINNGAKIVLGGALATSLPERMLQASQADAVVIGEGEKTIVELVSAIERNEQLGAIRGIAYRENGNIIVTEPVIPIADIDTIPFPARHLLEMRLYPTNQFETFGLKLKRKNRSTVLISSRGCPYSCTFCFKGMWGNKWRGRSPENLIEEMELLKREYGMNGFLFYDDTFNVDKNRVFKFCQLLKERELDVNWYCNTRANLLTKEMLEAMHDAGCIGVAFGIESGNQEVLDSIKKSLTLEQVRQAVKWTKGAGINVIGYFIFGLLGETKASIRQTLDFARELDLDFYGFSLPNPLPCTQLYDSAVEAGLISDDIARDEWTFHVNANLTQDCSDAELISISSEAFRDLYLKKRFGNYYFLNPRLLKNVALSIREKNQAKMLAQKAIAVLKSYRRRGVA